MKRSFWGALIFFLLAGVSSSAWAVDGAEAYLPVDFVICSDPAALKANEAHEKAWYETCARLNDAEKQELLEDQRRWLREFPPRCSVPAQGKSPTTISKDTQLCVMRALEDRQAFLEQYHNHAREVQSSTQTAAQPTETQAATGSMPSGQSSAAGDASNQSPSANKQTKDEISIDISKYTCQDMITDARDNNGSKATVALALIIAYTHAYDKLFPNNTTYKLDFEKFVNTVEQNCNAGERSVLVENVVENLLKQDRNSATAARSLANVPVIAQQDWQSRNSPPPNPGLLVFTFIDGNPACASYNGRDCLWGQNENQIDFSRVKPLICGEKHRQIWGGTGYDDSRHWCSLARE